MWAESSMSRVYPNMFVLLVAPPGVGKTQAIRPAIDLWRKTKSLKVSPDDVTKAALIDAVARSTQTKIYSASEMVMYHSLCIGADEFGVLIPSHDLSFMSSMNKLYDNVDLFEESRRGREGDLKIENPQVNLLAGTQPDFLANLLPPEAWGMGFMSRIIMIYQGKSPKPKLFGKKLRLETADLLTDLKVVCELHGECGFTPEAEEAIVHWYEKGLQPEPQHTKLKHYLPRRILNTLKLCIISSVARGNSLMVEVEDFERARDWLLEAEALMPDVFKDMGGGNDGQLIQDLHYYLWDIYSKNGQKAISLQRINTFLMGRTPAYNAENILKLCISTKIIISAGLDMYTPGDRNNLRDE